MTTHGRMLVRQADNPEEFIHLYAWHDGHFEAAIELLTSLPKTLFDFSKLSYLTWIKEKRGVHGPWFYDIIMSHDKDRTKKSLEGTWANILGLDLHSCTLANWITFVNFNHWTVVPSVDWCAYPGENPDIIIDVVDHRLGGYTLSFPDWQDRCGDDEDPYEPDLQGIADKINALIQDPDSHVTVDHEAKKIYVPFSKMIIDLIWQDIQKIQAANWDDDLKLIVDHRLKRNAEIEASIKAENESRLIDDDLSNL